MPIVTGLFTDLDRRAGAPAKVVVRTRMYATSWTARQALAGLLSIALSCVVVFVLVRPVRRSRATSEAVRAGLRSMWEARHVTDALVVGALLVWWVIAPTFTDDGWVWAEHRVFSDLGTNDVYLDIWGINSPTGFWFEWLRHWASGSTSELVFARIPSLACLLVSWFLCRALLGRHVARGSRSQARWTLAGAFLVGAVAWGMTLRPEPFISLLVLVSLSAMLAFVQRPRVSPLAIALMISILAVTAHPIGLLAAAPVIAGLPSILRWVYGAGWMERLGIWSVVLAAAALALIVFTVDADLAHRLGDAQTARASDLHSAPWWREYIRYTDFDMAGGATPVRRLSLALLLLSVAAFVTRMRWVKTEVSLLPARSVAIALALLAFVSSKWPWHFGTVLAIGAVAVTAEVERLRRERVATAIWLRQFWLLATVIVVTLWAWRAEGASFDLQTLSWSDGFSLSGYGLPVLAVVASAAFCVHAWRRGPNRFPEEKSRLSRAVLWAIPLAAGAVIAVTMGMLALDAAISPWSPARQNLEALAGGKSCGLGTHLKSDTNIVRRISDPAIRTLLTPAVGLFFPCVHIPGIENGLVEVPAYVISESSLGAWPLYEPDGPFAAAADLYELEVVGTGPKGVEVLAVRERVPGYSSADAVRISRPP
jgi:hypothetical protein